MPQNSVGTTLTFNADTNSTNKITFGILSFNANIDRTMLESTVMSTGTDSANSENYSPTYLGGMVKRTIDVTFFFDPAMNVSGIGSIPLMNTPAQEIEMIFSDSGASEWTSLGLISNFQASSGLDELIEGSMTITLSGPPTDGW